MKVAKFTLVAQLYDCICETISMAHKSCVGCRYIHVAHK